MLGLSALLLAFGWPAPAPSAAPLPPATAALVSDWPVPAGRASHAGGDGAWHIFSFAMLAPVMHQVRIEQHIIIRVVPRPGRDPQDLTNFDRPPPDPPRFVERHMSKCVPIADINGV